MLFRILALASLAAVGIAPAGAQTWEDVSRCRVIQEDARRLACYDGISLSPPRARTKYEVLPLEELRELALNYRGRLVEVSGFLLPRGESFILGLAGDDSDPMPVDVRALPRDQRQTLATLCGLGCQATIQGRVRPLNFVTGIVADSVIVR